MIQEFNTKKNNKDNGFQKNNKKINNKERLNLMKSMPMLFKPMNLIECKVNKLQERNA